MSPTLVLLLAAPALAQPPGPPIGPPTSPYLNLARPLNIAAVNYYGIVRPQQRQQQAIQSLRESEALINPFALAAAGQPLVTGNPFGFQNHRLYFQNQFSSGGFAMVGGGAGQPGTQAAGQLAPAIGAPPVRRR